MIRPDKGKYPVSQGFGDNPNKFGYGPKGHDGIDLGTPIGTPLYAPRNGTVKDVNNSAAYGLRITIDNGKNIDYVGHLSQALVNVGQHIKEGDLIAKSGASGQVTGPHTHWGVYAYNGTPQNPQTELNNNQGEEMTYPNEGDLINQYKRNGFPGHPPNANDIAYFTKGTNNPYWSNPNDVWVDLINQVADYKGSQVGGDAVAKLNQIKKIIEEQI